MARRFLLPCGNCDQKIVIETTQAGQMVRCSGCQNQIQVGTLRDIQALSSAEADSAGRTVEISSAKMSPVHRAMFVAGVVILAIGAFWGLRSMLRANELAAIPVESRLSEDKIKNLEAILAAEPPARMLDRWSEVKEAQVAEWVEDPSLKQRRLARSYRLSSWIGFALASLGLGGVATSLLLPTSPAAGSRSRSS